MANELERIASALERIAAHLDKKKPATRTPKVEGGSEVWELYQSLFTRMYGARPIRSAKVNSLCVQIIRQVGLKTALELIPYYLRRQDGKYTANKHPLNLLLADAQKLKVDLETGSVTTYRRAMDNERKSETSTAVMEFARGD